MKTAKIIAMAVSIGLVGCSAGASKNDRSPAKDPSKGQAYHEIQTSLTGGDDRGEIAKEKERLAKRGEAFWFDKNKTIPKEGEEPLNLLDYDKKGCVDSRAKLCEVFGLLAYKNAHPAQFKLGKCDQGLCAILSPEIPKTLIEKINANFLSNPFSMDLESYAVGDKVYTLSKSEDTGDYELLENDKVIFSRKMYYGAEGPYREKKQILGGLVLTFAEELRTGEKEGHQVQMNTFYKGEPLNEKYGLEGSQRLFAYRDKIGFVGTKNAKHFIFFNGQKVSGDFDDMRPYGCCAIFPYPFELDENGVLSFLAGRGGSYFLAEVNLNKYL